MSRTGVQTRGFSRAAVEAMAAVVLGVLLIVVCGWPWRSERDPARHRKESIRAASAALTSRPTEARIGDAFEYRPYDRTSASGRSNGSPVPQVTDLAAKLAREGAPQIDRAIADLFLGDLERAADRLEGALRSGHSEASLEDSVGTSSDVELLTACTAAWLAQSQGGDEPTLLALAAAERARQLAPQSATVRWNYALIVERLGLAPEAREAWRAYLENNSGDGWSDEARSHLRGLEWTPDAELWDQQRSILEHAFAASDVNAVVAPSARFPVRVRMLVEQTWIPAWAESEASHGPAADSMLGVIGAAARAIRDRTGDRQLEEFCIRAASSRGDRPFAVAHAKLASAQSAYRDRGAAAAADILLDARGTLEDLRSPLAWSAGVEAAGRLYRIGRHEDALRILDQADQVIGAHSWPLLAARSAWVRGLALTSIGAVGRASDAYDRAIRTYGSMHDATYNGMLEVLVGHNDEYAADLQSAWPRYVEGLGLAVHYGDPDRVLAALDSIGRATARNGHPRAAMFFNEALMRRAEIGGAFAPYLCHGLTTRCELEGRFGELATARQSCARARSVWSSLIDPSDRDRLEADLELATAGAEDPQARLDLLSRAVELSTRRKDIYRLSRVLLARGRAYEAVSDDQSARKDFESALGAIEEERPRLENATYRLTYFATSREIADELVRVLVRTGRETEALQVADGVRGRLLLDRYAAEKTAMSSDPPTLATSLEADRAIVEYWLDRDALFVWTIRRSGIAFAQVPASRQKVTALAGQFVAGMSTAEGVDANLSSSGLARLLIEPIVNHLEDVTTLTIVPDDGIADVPFAALRVGSGFLIERFTITRAPSLAAFVAMRRAHDVGEGVLVVASPETPLDVADLDARLEVGAALRASSHSFLLTGREATVSALCSRANSYSIIHVASHGFATTEFGEPAIALTGDAGRRDGLLTATTVERSIDLRNGTLVVLAACSTARGKPSSDGNLSLARAFLAAGAGTVVASLWNVDDAASAALFSRFYAALPTSANPARALRTAQLELLHSKVARLQWAAYQIIGGA